jgi:hypothetical protein
MLAFDQAGNKVAACRMTLGLSQAAETVPDQPLPLLIIGAVALLAGLAGRLRRQSQVRPDFRVYSGAWASRTIKNSRLTQCKGS